MINDGKCWCLCLNKSERERAEEREKHELALCCRLFGQSIGCLVQSTVFSRDSGLEVAVIEMRCIGHQSCRSRSQHSSGDTLFEIKWIACRENYLHHSFLFGPE